ncbi:MAG: hypothetical protein ACFFDF_16835, partial [Candidatus Odinarchaeota archaeon]
MIQGILSFRILHDQDKTGEIKPIFSPIQLIFREDQFDEENFSKLIVESDILAIRCFHTVGLSGIKYRFSNFCQVRLKETPYQVVSYFKQVADGTQYLAISIFELDDEIKIFEDLIKDMGNRLDVIFDKLTRARNSKQRSLIENINIRLKNEFKYTIFQIDRLSNLDNLQKVALIYNSAERLKILDTLRERPISKDEMKKILEKVSLIPNINLLLQPFLELNIIKEEWIPGEKNKKTGEIRGQGIFLFLKQDIFLARAPNYDLLNHFKETKHELYPIYQQKTADLFKDYDPFTQSIEDTQKLASMLLNPDIYDFFILLRHTHYRKDKIPKIFSEFAVTEILLENLMKFNVISEIQDNNDHSWIVLLTDIRSIFFPPYNYIQQVKKALRADPDAKISYDVAMKALTVLERKDL